MSAMLFSIILQSKAFVAAKLDLTRYCFLYTSEFRFDNFFT